MAQGTDNWGTYHISSDLQNYEVARSNYFTFVVSDFSKFSKLLRAGADAATAGDSDYINASQAQEYLKLSVDKASVPHFTLGVITIRRQNSVTKFAGLPEFNEGSLVVRDFIGLDTKSILMAWKALGYDVVNDKGGRAGDWIDSAGVRHIGYKQNCELIEYTADHQEIRRWRLIGCWISALNEDDFDAEAGDTARQISATFQYDRAIMVMPQ